MKLRRFSLIATTVFATIILFASCTSDYRLYEKRGDIFFETERPFPVTDRHGELDLVIDFRDYDISNYSPSRDYLHDIDAARTTVILKSDEFRGRDYVDVVLRAQGVQPHLMRGLRPNGRGEVVIDSYYAGSGEYRDPVLREFMSDFLHKLVARGQADLHVEITLDANVSIPVYVSVSSEVDMLMRERR